MPHRLRNLIVLSAALAGMVAGPIASAAAAETRYAKPFRLGSPFGGAPCTNAAAPCSITVALEQAAQGDTVVLAKGHYWKSSLFVIGGGGPEAYDEPLVVPNSVTLRGDDPTDVPVIHVAPNSQAEGGVELGASTKVRDLAIDGKAGGNANLTYTLSLGPNSVVDRVRVRTFGSPGTVQLSCSMAPGATLRNTLCFGRGTDADDRITAVSGSGSSATYTFRNVTAISDSPGGVGLQVGGSGNAVNGGAVVSAMISNSILRGTATDLAVRAGSDALRVTANVDHTNWRTQDVVVFTSSMPGATSTLVPLGGNQNGPTAAEPLFVDAAATDYRPAPGSPTTDAGVIDVNNGTHALGGQARLIGPLTDMGAYEFDPASVPTPTPTPTPSLTPAPSPEPTPTPEPMPTPGAGPNGGGAPNTTQSTPIDRTAPVLTGLAAAKIVTRRKGTTIRFTLSEAASVVLTFGQPKLGRTAGAKCVKQTAKNRKARRCTIANPKGSIAIDGKAGANSLVFKGALSTKKRLALGSYTLVAAPTDAAGNRGAAPSRKLTLKR